MSFPQRRIALAALAALWLGSASAAALADDFLDAAKQKVAAATMPKDKWDGPTTGPKAAAGKTIVFVAADMKNGGIVGVSKGVEEAGKAIGWTVRVIDGQGSVSGRTAALNQALALKPAGIVVGGFDTTEQKAAFEGAGQVGHPAGRLALAASKPGPNATAGLFANVTTDRRRRVRSRRAVGRGRLRRQGRRGDLHRQPVRHRGLQGRGDGGGDQEVRRLHRAELRGQPDRRELHPHAAR